jgi:sugar phosphate isomerase/epimerase
MLLSCSAAALLVAISLLAGKVVAAEPERPTTGAAAPGGLFARENLVAWCIVPFDAKQRNPQQRAEMLRRLGISKLAYDWRDQHVPSFEEEILQTKKNGIELVAFWGMHGDFVKLVRKYQIKPQFWVMMDVPNAASNEEKIVKAAQNLLPAVKQARELGCKLAIYNHGGWNGEPDNMVAVVRWLREKQDADHVGIVYNLHHGHGHLTDFPAALAKMKPYLFCLNLNGMVVNGDSRGMLILPLGQGDLDLQLLKTIVASGYRGPIGILNHTDEDAEARLQDNLDGLDWLVHQLDGQPAGPKPTPRTWKPK